MTALYDTLGIGYGERRRADPRIGALIDGALAGARSVVNVGAGAGSYEPAGCDVVAVEPSAVMIAQRENTTRVVRGVAEALPFADDAFDAALAVLTLHHWHDKTRGLGEMRRVARGPVVVMTWDPHYVDCWLHDYFPGLWQVDRDNFPPMAAYERVLGELEVRLVPVPHDCTDGFFGAYWRRPEAYLDRNVRAAISGFQSFDATPGTERLARDLRDGTWQARYAGILNKDDLDLGYRLIVA